MGDTVLYERREEIGIIKLNRPAVLNAVNDALLTDFLDAIRKASEDAEAKVIILTGEGRAFCAGADIKEQVVPRSMQDYREHAFRMQDVTRALLRMRKPIIAAIKGYALGEGMEFTLNCDIRIMADDAKVGFPESRVGATVTNGGTYFLSRIVGLGKAKELLLTAEYMGADEAYRVGYANKVVPKDEVFDAAWEIAKKIAGNSQLEVLLQKRMVEAALDMSIEQALEFETECACSSFAAGARQLGMVKSPSSPSRE